MIVITKGSFWVDPPGANQPGFTEINHTQKYRLKHPVLKGKGYQIDFTAKSQEIAIQVAELHMKHVILNYGLEPGTEYLLQQWVAYSGPGVPNGGFWNTIARLTYTEEEQADETSDHTY